MSDHELPQELLAIADLVTPMAVRVAATLRLADHIAAGTTTIDALAEQTGVNGDALGRIADHLATVGVFVKDGKGSYGLGPLGRRLLSDDPARSRDWLDIGGAVGRADLALLRLLDTVRTGKPAYPMVFGRSFWEDLAADPALSASFDALMGSHRQPDVSELVNTYDWGRVGHVVDVGGGNATLLSAILQAHPHLRGTLVDLPGPAAAAESNLAHQGLGERSAVVTGSFFDPLPAGADVYVLAEVLHDWDDDAASVILQQCGTAAGATGTVVIIEGLLNPDAERAVRTALDIRMLTYFAGRERTLADFEALGSKVGLVVSSIRRGPLRSMIEVKAANHQ